MASTSKFPISTAADVMTPSWLTSDEALALDAVLDRKITASDIDALVRDFTDPCYVACPFATADDARQAVQECVDEGDDRYVDVLGTLEEMTATANEWDDGEQVNPEWADPKHPIHTRTAVLRLPRRLSRMRLLAIVGVHRRQHFMPRGRARRRCGAGRPVRRRGSRRGAARAAPGDLPDSDEPPPRRLRTTSRAVT